MTVMLPFHQSLQTQRYEQPDGDGGKMQKKVAPTVNWLVRWMNIDHRGHLIKIH
jgi:hypothetical protein